MASHSSSVSTAPLSLVSSAMIYVAEKLSGIMFKQTNKQKKPSNNNRKTFKDENVFEVIK